MIYYKSIENFKAGLIEQILKTCYKRLVEYFPDEKERLFSQWQTEDNQAFYNPDTIGKYVSFTCIDNDPIGYLSWDDRQYPIGIIGQNCILPNYQGLGYGTNQIEMIIKIFRDRGYNEIKTVTGDHDFFIPAQKMYIHCGFKEKSRLNRDLFELIEFSKLL